MSGRKRKSGRARSRAANRPKCGHVCTCGCERRCVKREGHSSDPETVQHRYMTLRGARACPVESLGKVGSPMLPKLEGRPVSVRELSPEELERLGFTFGSDDS